MDSKRRSDDGRMSLMDIQAEQERDRRSNQQRASGGPRISYNNEGGGGSGGYGGGGGFQSRSNSGSAGAYQNRSDSGGRRGSQNWRGSDRSSLPLERGCICSLKDKFGFIHCADRPAEIFFHYSEVSNVHPDHLQMDDEVEFRVGTSRDNPDKLAGLEVVQLPAGTIEWEYEEAPGERFQGLIDRPLMRNSNNGGMLRRNSNENDMNAEGLIRLLVPTSKCEAGSANEDGANDDHNKKRVSETAASDTMTASDGPKIRFTANDFNPDSGGSEADSRQGVLSRKGSFASMAGGGRLFRGDLVEFTLVVEKRTRQKFARKIVLLQSERERSRLAKEEQLLANASVEKGVVVGLKQDFGFLRSNSRRDEVYFHYSHVQLPDREDKSKAEGSGSKEDGGDDHCELKIGQEMEFLVVTEEVDDRSNNNGGGRKVKTSARKVKFLPEGSVEFSKVVAEGVTGKVLIVPRADAGRNALKEHDPQSLGFIRLMRTLSTLNPANKNGDAELVEVDTVFLHIGNAPGGLFSCARGSAMGLWIRVGDSLLFDVTYDFVDKAYYATPTKHLVPACTTLATAQAAGGAGEKENEENRKGCTEDSDVAAKRAESNTVANNKGKNRNDKQKCSTAVRLVGLSLAGRAEGTVHTMKEAYGFIHFAERPVDVHFKQFEVLPDQLQEDLLRNMGLSSVLHKKAEMMGFHKLSSGTEVQFDLSVQGTVMMHNQYQHRGGGKRGAQNNQHERENLKAQRILILPKGTVLQNKKIGLGIKGVITKEDPNQPYAGILDLEEEFMQMGLSERHPLVVKMVEEFMQDEAAEKLIFHDIQSPKEEDVIEEILDIKAKGKYELTHIPQAGDSRYMGRLSISKVSPEKIESLTKQQGFNGVATPTTAMAEGGGKDEKHEEGKGVHEVEGTQRSNLPKERRSKSPKARTSKKKKALQQKLQPVKTIRYDKSSLTQNAKTEVPPGAGDVTVCDVHQNRRTGKMHLENLSVVERKVMEPEEAATFEGVTGVGVVKEVVLASKFGFVSVLNETASKRELLFFHFDSVVSQPRNQHGRGKKGGGHGVINKGDEVKFRIGTEKNGKRVAVDVQVVSAPTIPAKVDKNACRGYILVEPTDTKVGASIKHSRSFTRSRDAPSAPKSGGRWDNAKEDHHKDKLSDKGEGVILLLEDPSGMFTSVQQKSIGTKGEGWSETDSPGKPISVAGIGLYHLHYQNGAIALHGTGAPTTMDSSTNPRRGDLVSFIRSKNNSGSVKDIRVVTRSIASLVRGNLENIDHPQGKARFVCNVGKEKKEYSVNLKEVVSCDPKQLKNGVEVEGLLHQDAIHGVCRTTDLCVATKLGTGRKERPKLNLTVKKDRAGTIMAQSMMAKGPDGTTGFPAGWTTRVSKYSGD